MGLAKKLLHVEMIINAVVRYVNTNSITLIVLLMAFQLFLEYFQMIELEKISRLIWITRTGHIEK